MKVNVLVLVVFVVSSKDSNFDGSKEGENIYVSATYIRAQETHFL